MPSQVEIVARLRRIAVERYPQQLVCFYVHADLVEVVLDSAYAEPVAVLSLGELMNDTGSRHRGRN